MTTTFQSVLTEKIGKWILVYYYPALDETYILTQSHEPSDWQTMNEYFIESYEI